MPPSSSIAPRRGSTETRRPLEAWRGPIAGRNGRFVDILIVVGLAAADTMHEACGLLQCALDRKVLSHCGGVVLNGVACSPHRKVHGRWLTEGLSATDLAYECCS